MKIHKYTGINKKILPAVTDRRILYDNFKQSASSLKKIKEMNQHISY